MIPPTQPTGPEKLANEDASLMREAADLIESLYDPCPIPGEYPTQADFKVADVLGALRSRAALLTAYGRTEAECAANARLVCEAEEMREAVRLMLTDYHTWMNKQVRSEAEQYALRDLSASILHVQAVLLPAPSSAEGTEAGT